MTRPSRRRGYAPRIDAGGARERQMMQFDAIEANRKKWAEARDRVAQAAGRIPILKSLEDVEIYTTKAPSDFSFTGMVQSLKFPALQLAAELDTTEVFERLSKAPNVKAVRHNKKSVGPHFDAYASAHPTGSDRLPSYNYFPWTLHENTEGTGIIKATFLPSRMLAGYQALYQSLPETKASDDLLAQNRAAIGQMAMKAARKADVFVGDIAPGTRTLIWHGDQYTPPAVHDIQRTEPGSYTIYAIHKDGELGAGFEPIE